jgi:acetyl esterase/lipase
MKRVAFGVALAWAFGVWAAAAAEKPPVLDVWPGKPPGEAGKAKPETDQVMKSGRRTIRIVTNVSRPTLTVFRPAKERDTRVAVVICPGGGYHALAWDLEGTEVADWLNSIGVTGIVLKYRVPRPPDLAQNKQPLGPLQDAQRAVSLVRSKADAWGIDPKRIGLLGFSAGGHLTAAAATNFDRRAYEARDTVDRVSCRPDFAVLVYPAYLLTKDNRHLAPDMRVRKDCPPMFLVHAFDDPIPVQDSLLMGLALKQAGVPAELHVHASGGHGFGLRPSRHPCSTWPQRCADWMHDQRILTGRTLPLAPPASSSSPSPGQPVGGR